MDFKELAASRFSARKFKETPVEKEKLDIVLRVAQIAPTARNLQPQRILVLDKEDELSKLKDCTAYSWCVPLAIIICYDKNNQWVRDYDGALSGEIDASIVTTHMMMQAADIGLGTTWVMSFNPEKLIETYNIPEEFIPVAILVMGYPADGCVPSHLHEKREDIDKTVFYNQFS